MLRLLHTGRAALEQERSDAVRSRVEAIEASSGKYADVFTGDYLTELRQDWPK